VVPALPAGREAQDPIPAHLPAEAAAKEA